MDPTRPHIAKAGWLQRKSSVLHRWKKNWFVLYSSGHLAFFESPDHQKEEKSFVVCALCTGIETGGNCGFEAPEGCSKASLLLLRMRDGEDLKLCAESPDDMRAWQIALEEARVMNNTGANVPQGSQVVYPQTVAHGGYGGYPGHVISAPGQYVVPNVASGGSVVLGGQPGQVVCVREHPYGYHRGYYPMVYGPMFWW